ncbi:metal ABC transporter permease [Desulfothermobacter acidiphilus]|uniref:metal ABC transporter permease n=1 Tax=Desulfothermobacter acidiphilus TaxID=1938353 RepID=UPI003F8BC701
MSWEIGKLAELFFDPNWRWVTGGSCFLGVAAGMIGSFALLRRQALLGDAMSHAALPGVALAFLLLLRKDPLAVLAGASCSAGLAAFISIRLPCWVRVKPDTALAIVLTSFFGLGVVLLTVVAKTEAGGQSGLDSYLFGQAASLVQRDVKVMGVVALLVLLVLVAAFKEWKTWAFDRNYASTVGMPVRLMDFAFAVLLTLTVAVGLEAVGVVLMSALLITPPLTARYCTHRLDRMLLLAGALGALAGVVGALGSSLMPRLPTGPLIVLTSSGCFFLAMLLSPCRGLLVRGFRRLRMSHIYDYRLEVGEREHE